MPVPALVQPRPASGPHDDVRGAGPDLLVTARAPVGLGRRVARHAPDHPVAVWRRFMALRPQPVPHLLLIAPSRSWAATGQAPAWLAGQVSRQAPGLARTHGRHFRAFTQNNPQVPRRDVKAPGTTRAFRHQAQRPRAHNHNGKSKERRTAARYLLRLLGQGQMTTHCWTMPNTLKGTVRVRLGHVQETTE